MLRLLVQEFGQGDWTDLVSKFQDLSLLQTWEYASAKAQTGPWKVERVLFADGKNIIGAVQALVRRLPWVSRGLVWINRGPLWKREEKSDASILIAMMEELRRHWVDKRHMVLRVAPTGDEGELNLAAIEDVGFRIDGSVPGWASARIDLSRPLDSLRAQLQQKWRNCLNKAERCGLVVRSGTEDPIFREFLAEYDSFLHERRFSTSVTPALLSQLQSLSPSRRKPWVVTAGKEGKSLGSILIARYGATSEYLAGPVNEAGRQVNAGQLLLWRAVCEMKDQGYRWFDLGGMDPDRTPSGIFHFKSGMGGTPHRLLGEVEADNGGWLSRVIRLRVQQARRASGG